jgi:glycosyltransferase involved in cell wall biosynthesis
MKPKQPTYSIVIPCYRSRHTIEELLERIDGVFAETGDSYEVICVDDGSPDDVGEVILGFRETHRQIQLVRHHRNYGQQRALLTGMRYVRGEYVVTLDDDLQNPPEEIPKLIAGLGKHDVVVGRPVQKQHKHYRNLGSLAIQAVLKGALNPPKTFSASPFRLMRRSVANRLAELRTVYPHMASMLLLITRDIVTVDVRHDPRKQGRSGYSLFQLGSLASNVFINYTSVPLRAMTLLGVLISAVSFIFILFIVIRKLTYVDYQLGWPSLVVVITFFGGVNLLSLAVVGEYLLRLLREGSGVYDVAIRSEDVEGRI